MNIQNEDKKDKINKILHISFNQDNSCFSIGTENGFIIYKTNSPKIHNETKMDGGIRHSEMYYHTNILGLIGGGEMPKFNPKKLIIWDDYEHKVISEIKFFSNLKNVKIRKDRIFAICDKNIYAFDMQTFENIEIINTRENPKGLFGINGYEYKIIIAYLGAYDSENNHKGSVTIKNYERQKGIQIIAQEDSITYLSLNHEGTLLATSNEKGTIIKIHNCVNGDLLSQFKRGKEKAEIHYICFDKFSNFLAVTSDRGTIHIWSLGDVTEKIKNIKEKEEEDVKKIDQDTEEDDDRFGDIDSNENKINIIEEKNEDTEINDLNVLPKNKKTIFGQFERSFAQIRINSNNSICCFLKNYIIAVITYEGMYYKAQLDTKIGGNCKIIFQESLNI